MRSQLSSDVQESDVAAAGARPEASGNKGSGAHEARVQRHVELTLGGLPHRRTSRSETGKTHTLHVIIEFLMGFESEARG